MDDRRGPRTRLDAPGRSAMPDDTFDLKLLDQHEIPIRHFDAGEKIFLQGDIPAAMYVVRTGLVHILSFGRVLEDVRPGAAFGEMAVLDEAPRSAAAMAGADTEVAVIDRPALMRLLRSEPEIALAIMRLLARRLRRMGEHRDQT